MRNIYVFGSDRQGRHGLGCALQAKLHHGAIYGQAEGLQGNSYAIITKELRHGHPPVALAEVRDGVNRFIKFAKGNPELNFQVTPIGCGLAGFRVHQIAPMFTDIPPNVILNEDFIVFNATKFDNQSQS